MNRPLVYATRRALEDAARLLPGAVLENAVEDAILRGDVSRGQGGGFVFGGKEWVARVRRVPARVAARHAWLVIEVQPHRERGRQWPKQGSRTTRAAA